MGKDKTVFHLHSGDYESNSRNLVYKYGNTSGIKISVAPLGYSVTVARCASKTPAEILKDNLFRDALRKVSRLQLVLYGKLSNSPVYISIDGIEHCLTDNISAQNGSLIYSLCGTTLQRKIDSEWNDDALQGILNTTKSNSRRIDAALDALLIAKSKVYEFEKFVYLWMAMNGIYGYSAEIGRMYTAGENEKRWLKKEFGQLKFFCMLNDLSYRGNYENGVENNLLNRIEELLTDIEERSFNGIREALITNDLDNPFVSGINDIFSDAGLNRGEMHPYAAILVFTSYRVRCKYFHAEKAIPLFCLENEHPIPILRFLNYILEDYLDNCIASWFDNILFTADVVPTIRRIAESCIADRSGRLTSCIVDGRELH